MSDEKEEVPRIHVQQPSRSEAARKTFQILDQLHDMSPDARRDLVLALPIEHLAAWHTCAELTRIGVVALEEYLLDMLDERGYHVRARKQPRRPR